MNYPDRPLTPHELETACKDFCRMNDIDPDVPQENGSPVWHLTEQGMLDQHNRNRCLWRVLSPKSGILNHDPRYS